MRFNLVCFIFNFLKNYDRSGKHFLRKNYVYISFAHNYILSDNSFINYCNNRYAQDIKILLYISQKNNMCRM